MNRGRQTCKILKDIRRQIAAANDIELAVSECRYKGDCPGTCPRCEAEVRYLEQALERRRMAGKAVSLLGISAGLLATPAASTAEEAAMEASIAKEATIKQHFINADSTIEVTGRVVDAEGIPIPEVLVVAENKRVGTVTDSLGRFSLSVFGGEQRLGSRDGRQLPHHRAPVLYGGGQQGHVRRGAQRRAKYVLVHVRDPHRPGHPRRAVLRAGSRARHRGHMVVLAHRLGSVHFDLRRAVLRGQMV